MKNLLIMDKFLSFQNELNKTVSRIFKRFNFKENYNIIDASKMFYIQEYL